MRILTREAPSYFFLACAMPTGTQCVAPLVQKLDAQIYY